MSERPDLHTNPHEAPNSGEQMFQERYEKLKSLIERNIQIKTERLAHLREVTVPQKIQQYEEKYGHPPTADWIASFTVGAEQGLKFDQQRLEFLRPTSNEDISYRNKVEEELPKRIRENCPPDLPLRFHGTPIYRARDVVHSKGLSSSVDRLGRATSYDVSDQVSVTTPDSVNVTIDGYTGLFDDQCNVPAGVIFVLLPSSLEEAEGGSSLLMGNVDFENHPEQLFAIVTSAENLPNVERWCQESDIGPVKISEFFEFAEDLGRLKTSIQEGAVNMQDLVPYLLQR